MISLELQGDQFILHCPARYRDMAKQTPLRYSNKIDAYYGPATWAAANMINGIFARFGLHTSPEVGQWVANEAQRLSSILARKKALTYDGPTLEASNGFKLFPFQQQDAVGLAEMGSGLLLSDRGTGKGPTALSALRLLSLQGKDIFPLLIVTRPVMVYSLAEEVERWLPEARTIQPIGKGWTPKAREAAFAQNADVYVIPWHMLSMHSKLAPYGALACTPAQKQPKELNGRFKSAYFDEAHRMLTRPSHNDKALTTRAAWAVLDECGYRYLATGTGIKDDPDELWSLLRGAFPNDFPSYPRFRDRYADMVPQFFGGDKCIGIRKDTEAEFRQIFEPVHVMRLKEDVLPSLPPKVYRTVTVEMTPKQQKVYTALTDNSLVKIGDEILAVTDPLVKKLRQLQIAAALPVIKDGEVIALSEPSCKVDALLELLEEDENPTVVFMASRKLLDLCAARLTKEDISFVEFKGGMKDRVREMGLKQFQSGTIRVALCLLQSASEGITLTAASRTIYLQRSDNMVDSIQSEDRTHRIGQIADRVEIIDVITKDTVEMEVHVNVTDKERRMNELFGINREQRRVG